MQRYKTGLIVGKFSPLHKGHEFAIRRAQQHCETLLILSYSKPEFPGCTAARREKWLRGFFPGAVILVLDDERLQRLKEKSLPANDADDCTHRAFVAWVCRAIFGQLPEAVFTSEAYGPGFADHLSRDFGIPVMHVAIDMGRKTYPISGTAIRADIHAHRDDLSPDIYADFVETVCFLGAESTGKSTLAEKAARHFNTVQVPEYGRTLWEEKDGKLVYEDMLKIAQTHIAHESTLRPQANRFLFVDTSPLTTLFYSEAMFEKADACLAALSHRRYDHVFLCMPDFPMVQDGTRISEGFRARQHAWYTTTLAARGIGYTCLGGSEAERLKELKQLLATSA